ncbi:sphingomyelin synthase-related protein 1-like [Sycon ciliatum]|uniref:sphingomyelin synthase-related protein 1-like n=1 Tax=Sycon ciliatum TaxID=27933 RepID=UPI0031F60127
MGGETPSSLLLPSSGDEDHDGGKSHAAGTVKLVEATDSHCLPDEVELWTCDHVSEWLERTNMGKYCELLCVTHCVDGPVLLSLKEKDLKEPPLSMCVLGDIKRLYKAIQDLQKRRLSAVTPDTARHLGLAYDVRSRSCSTSDDIYTDGVSSIHIRKRRLNAHVPDNTSPRKVLFTMLYGWFVIFLTAFTMTIVHSRVPDMTTYRPLPDIALDNIPHIPWAFQVSEAIAVFFSLTLVSILLFHKHRLLIMCRLFSLLGTVFLLRCCTLFVTSLSVPGDHLKCKPLKFDSYEEILWRSMEITSGFGMSLTGVHTCGDYMFSGHTAVLTMLNLAITEYTPRRWRTLHMTTWIMNIFGIFFILAAHEHYSIDVVIAFVITSRLFLYYHALANSRALMAGDQHRLREWFPLFTFVEEHWNGERVPNVYSNPVEDLRIYIKERFFASRSSGTPRKIK